MLLLLIILFILIIFGLIGWLLFTSIFDLIVGKPKEQPRFIDNSKHYHEHKHLTIINKDKTTVTIEDERIRTDI